jgi:hypothetical protein
MTEIKTFAPTAAAILAGVAELLRTTFVNYRDGKIEVGRQLHRYMLARIKEADGLSRRGRYREGISREEMIRDIAKSLKITDNKIRELIRVSQVVDLLTVDGDVGDMSYTVIRRFGRTIHRTSDSVVDYSSIENWTVDPQCVEWAADMFATARNEHWGVKKADAELSSRLRKSSRKRSGMAALVDKLVGRQSSQSPVVPLNLPISGDTPLEEAASAIRFVQERYGHIPQLKPVFDQFALIEKEYKIPRPKKNEDND